MQYLRQGTACTIVLGPYYDAEDGNTVRTDLTIAQASVRLSKNGAAFAQVGEATTAPHGEHGCYLKALSTTDTNTAGRLFVNVPITGTLGYSQEFVVLPQQAYDALVLGTDLLQVDSREIGGTAQTAGDLVDTANDIKAKTELLPTDPADQSLIIAATDAIMGRLGAPEGASIAADIAGIAAGDAPTAAEIAAEVLCTALTEGYATDGAAFTLEQAMFMIWSFLVERRQVGTTITTRRVNGAADAMTFTLDSATAPTTQTRAT